MLLLFAVRGLRYRALFLPEVEPPRMSQSIYFEDVAARVGLRGSCAVAFLYSAVCLICAGSVRRPIFIPHLLIRIGYHRLHQLHPYHHHHR
jgi:hypothetical protein